MARVQPFDAVAERPLFFKAQVAPAVVSLPRARYLTISGAGTPEGEAFQHAVGALYGLAYTLKFAKRAEGLSFKVAPLEGLWWCEPAQADIWKAPRSTWRWKLLIMVPDVISQPDVRRAAEALRKKHAPPPTAPKLESLQEGLCVQALHVGPYATEAESIARMRALMDAEQLEPHGAHHEVYLGDPRRTAPARLKTILRQPVTRH